MLFKIKIIRKIMILKSSLKIWFWKHDFEFKNKNHAQLPMLCMYFQWCCFVICVLLWVEVCGVVSYMQSGE